MTGAQLPAIVRSTALRVPDAVFAPATIVPPQRDQSLPPPASYSAHPYQQARSLPAGLLVDLYG